MSTTRWVGYCTNVHAGATLLQTKANLEQHATRVRDHLAKQQPLAVGLWLSADAAASLCQTDAEITAFGQWLQQHQLMPYTLNGFPYGDFHQKVVKLDVYQPTWMDRARLAYTLNLIKILDRILPAGDQGSISTVPLAWGEPSLTDAQLKQCANQLLELANHLQKLEETTGRLIFVCLEPEPGCQIDTTNDMIRFFQEYLFQENAKETVARYLRVCHDVCHAAVMFEDQSSVLKQYAEAGILVGKVQVSSAIEVDFSKCTAEEKQQALRQLSAFSEDRYMHQTSTAVADAPSILHHDLPPLLEAAQTGKYLESVWRIHFHMPIYLTNFGQLKTTQSHILDFLNAGELANQIPHWEVETYAWGVLPVELQQQELASGIAAEIEWFNQQIENSRGH